MIVAIAQNAKTFELHFIPKMANLLKRQPELIMHGLKDMSMKVDNLFFLDCVYCFPCRYASCPRCSV